MDQVCERDVRYSVCRYSRRAKPTGAGACRDRGLATLGGDSRLRGGVLSPRAVGAAAHVTGVRPRGCSRLTGCKAEHEKSAPANKRVRPRGAIRTRGAVLRLAATCQW